MGMQLQLLPDVKRLSTTTELARGKLCFPLYLADQLIPHPLSLPTVYYGFLRSEKSSGWNSSFTEADAASPFKFWLFRVLRG
jgi:hypothetical protein